MRALRAIDALPLTHELLVEGGDDRISLDSGRNAYGCKPYPDPVLAQFGSSTASTVSERAFGAADALRERISGDSSFEREFGRIREEFASYCDLPVRTGMLFCASGTDAHRLARDLASPGLTLMVAASETGRGVPDALSGGAIRQIRIRDADGIPRAAGEIDDEVRIAVESCVKEKVRTLVVLVDVSKTGMIAPSLSCVAELKTRFPDWVEVLVDASQFRIMPATLRHYLVMGFMVAVTGSKFLTGPTFSGALLIPNRVVRDNGGEGNVGLLLRWEAAMEEFRAFRGIPEFRVESFLHRFADAVGKRLEEDPHFEPLAVPKLERRHSGWDSIQTIFSFRMKKKGGFLDEAEAKRIHALMKEDLSHVSGHEAASLPVALGQPVACGALRLGSSARLAVEGAENGDRVIGRALQALDKAAWLLEMEKSWSKNR